MDDGEQEATPIIPQPPEDEAEVVSDGGEHGVGVVTVAPDAGLVLCHHTRKITKKQLVEDPFMALSGAGSLRSFYSSGIIMHRPDEDRPERIGVTPWEWSSFIERVWRILDLTEGGQNEP